MVERVVNFRVSHLPNEPPVCYLGEENAKPRWMRNEPPRPYHSSILLLVECHISPEWKLHIWRTQEFFPFSTIIHNPRTFSICPTSASSPLKPTILLFSYVSILPRRSKEGRPNCSKAYCLDSGIDTTTTTVRLLSRSWIGSSTSYIEPSQHKVKATFSFVMVILWTHLQEMDCVS
jgi:hypothetical protein